MDVVVVAVVVVAAVVLVAVVAASQKRREDQYPSRPASQRLRRRPLGVTVACISDTHGAHRELTIPKADILIHAGDFTHFGKEEQARDFNEWLGTQPHKTKVVVNGNHEHNAPWKEKTREILSNAIFLCNEETVTVDGVKIFGTEFYWPMKTSNPHYDQIPNDTEVVVCHGPCKGIVDGGFGCETMLETVARVQPRLVVSGHIHKAHGGPVWGGPGVEKTLFVNAANVKNGYTVGWSPVVVEF